MNDKTSTLRKAPTMQDVAHLAGVTPMTVSNVFGNKGRVSEEKRQQVLRAAQELDFYPNAIAQSLARRRTNIIGLYSGVGYLDARNEFLAEILGGLQSGCDKFHKDLLVHGAFAGRSSEDIYREVASGKIDGLVVLHAPQELAKRLAESHLPMVVIADAIEGAPSVVVDDAGGSRLLANHLHEKGYRQIIYRRRLASQSAFSRFGAFLDEAEKLGLCIHEFWADESDHVCLEEQKLILSACHQEKTAIVGWEDNSARFALYFCRKNGVRVPEDVGIAGFNGVGWVGEYPSLTTIRAPWAKVAQTAVELLQNQLDGKDVTLLTTLPVELHAGETT